MAMHFLQTQVIASEKNKYGLCYLIKYFTGVRCFIILQSVNISRCCGCCLRHLWLSHASIEAFHAAATTTTTIWSFNNVNVERRKLYTCNHMHCWRGRIIRFSRGMRLTFRSGKFLLVLFHCWAACHEGIIQKQSNGHREQHHHIHILKIWLWLHKNRIY